jgi:demethylmenaquinone methyltransferase/2-methoxy-6-polyprenyl-1,4-benzoquinol methylase
MPDPREVRSMFARISGRYDLLNHVLSAGVDRSWRRATVAAGGGAEGVAGLRGRLVVDVCCGTGDLSLAFARAGARVVGVDFTPEMLVQANRKGAALPGPGAAGRPDGASEPAGARGVLFAAGDALALPLADDAADLASVAFGVRNLADPLRGLKELVRVVRPGGKVLVLEFSPPAGGLVGGLYRTYFTRVLPVIGGLVSGDREAYRYLPRTVSAWPGPEQVLETLRAAGLEDCGWRAFTLGIACLHWGTVPGSAGDPHRERSARA